jgi:hypothetical protein
MNKSELNTFIGFRKFAIKGLKNNYVAVTNPSKSKTTSDEWICSIIVSENSIVKKLDVRGIDSFQALRLAMNLLNDEITFLMDKHKENIKYLGQCNLLI